MPRQQRSEAPQIQPDPDEVTKPRPTDGGDSNKLQALLWNPARKLGIDTKRNKDGSIDPSGQLQLNPGWNFVPLALWRLAEKNEQIQRLIHTTIPQVRAVEEALDKVGEPYLIVGKVVDKDNPLRTMETKEALRFVQETLVIPTLKMLLGQESRAEVLRALRDKIDNIERPIQAARAAKIAQGEPGT